MHASIEQLLTIRDGGLVDAATRQHAEHCDRCREQLRQLQDTRAALNELPPFAAPAGVWARIEAGLETRGQHRRWWPAAAAAALVAVAATIVVLQSFDKPPAQTYAVAEPDVDKPVAEPAPELPRLVTQSRQLEQLLRKLDADSPRVMNADTAGTIAGLQDSIAYIDYGLSHEGQPGGARSEQLWRQRVDLMNTLVQVRSAQLQQVSAERRY